MMYQYSIWTISRKECSHQFLHFYVTVQPCAGLNEKVCCKLACISTFSSKSAYGGTTKLLVFMNMKTRRCNGWTVTIYSNFFVFIVDKPVDPWYYIGGSKNTVNVFAALAQLVERRLGKAEVGSSNLLGSLNHEAFRNIREAFFRVTGNFLLYEKVRTRQWCTHTQDARTCQSNCLLQLIRLPPLSGGEYLQEILRAQKRPGKLLSTGLFS